MKLYLLEAKDQQGYDCANAFVVRASSAKEAREIAGNGRGGEGKHTWRDSKRSTCTQLTDDGPAGMILRDFSAG